MAKRKDDGLVIGLMLLGFMMGAGKKDDKGEPVSKGVEAPPIGEGTSYITSVYGIEPSMVPLIPIIKVPVEETIPQEFALPMTDVIAATVYPPPDIPILSAPTQEAPTMTEAPKMIYPSLDLRILR